MYLNCLSPKMVNWNLSMNWSLCLDLVLKWRIKTLKNCNLTWLLLDAKAETPVLWPPHTKSWLIGKDSDAGKDWGQEEKGTTEDEMAGWTGRPGVLQFMGSQRVGHDWATELNWATCSVKTSRCGMITPKWFQVLALLLSGLISLSNYFISLSLKWYTKKYRVFI